MTEEKLVYFSPAEFLLMMELAGGDRYFMLKGAAAPDETALIQAFSTLFGRGLLQRAGDRFVPSAGEQNPFVRMRRAKFVTQIRASWGYDAIGYWDQGAVWMVELSHDKVSQWYRVQRVSWEGLERWLMDRDILWPPILQAEDAARLEGPLLDQPAGETLSVFEKYRNGGELLERYELSRSWGGQLRRNADETEIYTTEALAHMLAECFGKDAHDYCEREGARH